MLEIKNLIIENMIVFRSILFFCVCFYAIILYSWLRPNAHQFKAAMMAIMVQFWIGLLLDGLLVEFGFWQYRAMDFIAFNVPIDLHFNWAILWGLGICWLFDKWPGQKATLAKFFIYLMAWTFLTLCFDMMMVDWMIFLSGYATYWWLADTIFLFVVQGFTVWFYCSVNKACGEKSVLPFLPIIPPYIRGLIYLSFLTCLFFIYIPQQIDMLIQYFGMEITTYHFSWISYILLAIAIIIGGWATYEFAQKGEGTPLPLDGPQYLVTSGPYLFMSNPMQVSGILLVISILFFNFNWINFIYLIDVILVVWLIFERFEAIELRQSYGEHFQRYLRSVPLWKIRLVPKKLDERFRPTLFIDKQCQICLDLSEQFQRFDRAQNIKIRPLTEIRAEDYGHHLASLAQSNTTMIFAEPRVRKGGQAMEVLYSTKGKALLRLLGYLPVPFCLAAAYGGIPGSTLLANFGYTLFARIRKYL